MAKNKNKESKDLEKNFNDDSSLIVTVRKRRKWYKPSTFLWKYPLPLGVKIISLIMIVVMIICIISVIANAVIITMKYDLSDLIVINALACTLTELAFSILMLIAHVYLYMSTKWTTLKKKYNVLTGWLATQAIWLIHKASLLIISMFLLIKNVKFLLWLLISLLAIIALVILVYFWLIVYSYWSRLRREKRRQQLWKPTRGTPQRNQPLQGVRLPRRPFNRAVTPGTRQAPVRQPQQKQQGSQAGQYAQLGQYPRSRYSPKVLPSVRTAQPQGQKTRGRQRRDKPQILQKGQVPEKEPVPPKEQMPQIVPTTKQEKIPQASQIPKLEPTSLTPTLQPGVPPISITAPEPPPQQIRPDQLTPPSSGQTLQVGMVRTEQNPGQELTEKSAPPSS